MATYLGVGIHENVVLGKSTGINDKGSLVIELETIVDDTKLFAAFDDGASVEQSAQSVIMWPVNMTTWDGKPKSATQIGQDLNNYKNTLVDILEVFMTTDLAKEAINASVMFAGLGVTPENQATLPTRLLNEDFVKGVYKNISYAFITAAKPFMGETEFRVKLRRTSKSNHFASIPKKGKFKESWIEPMTVPLAAASIKWSTYEIKEGLNHGVKVEADTSSESANAKVGAMFDLPPAPTQEGTVESAPAANTNPFNQSPVTPEQAFPPKP